MRLGWAAPRLALRPGGPRAASGVALGGDRTRAGDPDRRSRAGRRDTARHGGKPACLPQACRADGRAPRAGSLARPIRPFPGRLVRAACGALGSSVEQGVLGHPSVQAFHREALRALMEAGLRGYTSSRSASVSPQPTTASRPGGAISTISAGSIPGCGRRGRATLPSRTRSTGPSANAPKAYIFCAAMSLQAALGRRARAAGHAVVPALSRVGQP